MSWAHPFCLGLVPIALVAVWLLFHRAGGGDGACFANIRRLWADRHGLSDRPAAVRRRLLRGVCLAAGAVAALLALARPQWGEVAEQRYDQSREVVLALDLSRSMLADDVSPSRLARAKLLISSLLDQLAGERVGLIVFPGTAFVQSPLSADYEVLRDFLDELDPSYLPEGGTDYESMLRTAVQAFGQQGDGDRYLVVLSDGEALDENWKALIPSVREGGIHVIGLGVGTPEGALVPDGQGALVKDEHGAAVLSRLEPRTLQELAAETGGTYRDAATWVDIAELVNATVEQGTKGTYVEQRAVRLQDRFQWFLGPALLFLLLSLWLEFPIFPLARALPRRGRRPHPASAPVIAAALLGLAAWHSPRLACAAVSDVSPPLSGTARQPNPLTTTVAELSGKPTLGAADYARLATDTIAFASQPNAPHGRVARRGHRRRPRRRGSRRGRRTARRRLAVAPRTARAAQEGAGTAPAGAAESVAAPAGTERPAGSAAGRWQSAAGERGSTERTGHRTGRIVERSAAGAGFRTDGEGSERPQRSAGRR